MKAGVTMVGKVVAVVFALCLLGGYVWYSQIQSKPSITPVSGTVVLPETPASPTMFSTSKSGPVHMTPGVSGMVERKMTIRSFVIDPDEPEEPPGISIETPTEVIVSSKAINMPVFNVKKVKGNGEDPFSAGGETEPGIMIETPTGITLGSKSISMPVFNVRPAENIVPIEASESEEQPLLNSTKVFVPVLEPERLREMVEEAKGPDEDS